MVPIGLDPLPRPAAQRAFGLELAGGEDLELLEGVRADTFKVTEKLALACSERVGGAMALRPSDTFEKSIESLRKMELFQKKLLKWLFRVD